MRGPSRVFSINLLVRISMTSFPAFSQWFVQSYETPVEKLVSIRLVKFNEDYIKSFYSLFL